MDRDVPAREDGVRAEKRGGRRQRGDCKNKSSAYRRGDVSRSIVSTLTPSLSHFFLGYRSAALAPFDRIHSTLFASFSATLAANRVRSLARANNRRAQMKRSKAHIISHKETEREREREAKRKAE